MLTQKLKAAAAKSHKIEAPAVRSKIAAAATDEDRADALEVLAGAVAKEFEDAINEYTRLRAKVKALTEKQDAAKEAITAIVEKSGHKTLWIGDYQATYVPGARREKLDPKLLLQAGVTVRQIEKATVVTTGKPYVTISEVKS